MSKPKPGRKPRVPEHMTAEKNYDDTGDVLFAALKIGELYPHPPKWALKACEVFAESLFGPALSAAFAIGQAPGDPSKEAILACQKLAERSRIAHKPLLQALHPGTKGYAKDDFRLEKMADLVATGMSARATARKVADEDDVTAERLQKKWSREFFDQQSGDGETDIDEVHERWDRGLAKRAGKNLLFQKKP